MEESKITTAGQTTIPVAVRKYLGITGGDKVRYFLEEGRAIMIPAKTSIRDLKGMLPKPGKAATLEEMDDAIAEASEG